MNSLVWLSLAVVALALDCCAESAQVPRYYQKELQRQPEQPAEQTSLMGLTQTIQTILDNYGSVLLPVVAIIFFVYAYLNGYSFQQTNEIMRRSFSAQSFMSVLQSIEELPDFVESIANKWKFGKK